MAFNSNASTEAVVLWESVRDGSVEERIHLDTRNHGRAPASYARNQPQSDAQTYRGMRIRKARLQGLVPGQRYYFVISDGMSANTSSLYWFQTGPEGPSARLSLIAGGDSRNHRDARRDANRLVARLKPHAVLFDGDMTDKDSDSQWVEWLDDWSHSIGMDGRLTPLIVARGNHEKSNEVLSRLFDAPESLYYTVDFGDDLLRVFTLNTESAVAGEQRTWLKTKLEESASFSWIFTQYHQPMRPHTSRKPEGDAQYAAWAGLFLQYGVDLAMECDSHLAKLTWPVRPDTGAGSSEGFIRDDVRGTVFIGEGGWGAPLKKADDNKPWTRDSASFNHFQWIFVDRTRTEVRTVLVGNSDEVPAVSDDGIFTPPDRLSLWHPPNGPVAVLER